MKKVLFISPTPTHPTNAGNRAHIKSLVTLFKEQDFDVHFLYLAYEEYNKEVMQSFHGNNLKIIDRNCIYQNKKIPEYILWKLNRKLHHLKRKMQRLRGRISPEQYQYDNEVDDYFSVFAGRKIKEIAKKEKFDVVVCEYASMSKALTYFGKKVLKILDTHDLFTDRYKIFLQNGLQPSWISLYKDQEQKAINRANLVLAVQETDKQFFSSISNVEVVVYNYVPEPVMLPDRTLEKKLLYIASGNKTNIASIDYFLESVFPLILEKEPGTTLIIGGSICDVIKAAHPNVTLYGKVDDLKDFYSLGDIVINPEKGGTGYKVKALEALAYGMPLVSTTAGAVGATEPFRDHLFIADEPEEFAKTVNLLFQEPILLKNTSANAHQWIQQFREKTARNMMVNMKVSKAY